MRHEIKATRLSDGATVRSDVDVVAEPQESREVRRAQRKGQDALRRASVTPIPAKRNRAELGAVAGEMRRAMHGNGRYTPPARKGRR